MTDTTDTDGARADTAYTAPNEALPVAHRAAIEVGRLIEIPLAPGLYLVATPIGNLADITLRALSVLARADVIYCEDTRHSRTLLAHYGIGEAAIRSEGPQRRASEETEAAIRSEGPQRRASEETEAAIRPEGPQRREPEATIRSEGPQRRASEETEAAIRAEGPHHRSAKRPRLEAYHEHNGARERPRILARLAAGQRVALISDAGTPLISDPGYKLVREAIDAGHRVESLPGPSAALTALTSSGLPSDAFLFAGFLPVRSAGRRSRATELAAVPATLVFYEAPSRIADSLADLAAALGPRPAAIARELTKRFETIRRGTLPGLAAELAAEGTQKGEFVILVGPPLATEATDDDIRVALKTALRSMSLRDAAKSVADSLDTPKSRVYDLGVAMRAEDEA